MHAQDDIFTLSSTTALGIGESLIYTLITIIVNLPEPELHKIHHGMRETLGIADGLLQNLLITSGFEMLSLNCDTYALFVIHFSPTSLSLFHRVNHPGRGRPHPRRYQASQQFLHKDCSPRGSLIPTAYFVTLTLRQIRAPPPSPVSPAAGTELVNVSPVFANDPAPMLSKPSKSRTRKAVPATNAPTQRRVGKGGIAHPIIVSSRPHIRIPDYSLHPTFVHIGSEISYAVARALW